MSETETPKRKYDHTVARVAGNILSGCRDIWVPDPNADDMDNVKYAVKLARMVVAEVVATEPKGE